MGNVFQILAIMFVLQALSEPSSQPKSHNYKELNLASSSEDFGSGFWASEESKASDGWESKQKTQLTIPMELWGNKFAVLQATNLAIYYTSIEN